MPAVFAEDACKPLALLKKKAVDYTVALMRNDKVQTDECRRAMHEHEEFMAMVVAELVRT